MSDLADMGPINATTYPHGVRCACDCGCRRELNDGNAMRQEVSAQLYELVCVECYVGNHPQPIRRG